MIETKWKNNYYSKCLTTFNLKHKFAPLVLQLSTIFENGTEVRLKFEV